MHEAIAVVITTVTAAIASIAAALAQVPLPAFQGPAILDDERARLICLAGALGGGLLNLGLGLKEGDKPPGIRVMVWKIFGSTVTGVVFTPFVVKWFGLTPNTDTLLGVSFVMAIVGVGLLRTLLPLYQRYVASKLGLEPQDVQVGDIAAPAAPSAPVNQSSVTTITTPPKP
jgi:hypothetical protein